MRAPGLTVLTLSIAAFLGPACGSNDASAPPAAPAPPVDAGGVDAPVDASLTLPSACVVSPEAHPFPSGACNAPKPGAPDALDEALQKVGLDRCTLGPDPKLVQQGIMSLVDARKMPDFLALSAYPLRLPDYGAETAAWLDAAMAGANPVSTAIAAAAERRGTPVTDCADPAWFAIDGSDPAPLATALGELAGAYGASFDPAATASAVAPLPLDLQQALVPVVRAIGYGARDVAAALAKATPKGLADVAVVAGWIIGTVRTLDASVDYPALDAVDVGKMASVAARVAGTIEAASLARFAGRDVPAVEIDTPFGAVVVHGAGSDTYLPGSKADGAAFVLDTGGDDTYRVAAGATSATRALSVNVDLAGKDTYAYVEVPAAGDGVGHRLPSDGAGRDYGITLSRTPRQGAGVLGVGLLYDLGAGADTYKTLAAGQGAGLLGVGVLYDDGGNDSYTAEALSQGAGGFGIGLLLDAAGADTYYAYTQSQGMGFTRGFGALDDAAGDDAYTLDPGDPTLGGDPIYPNAQLPGPPQTTLHGQTSMGQGCGEGFRSDSPSGQWAGGMGVLRDLAGNDKYTASVFAQGTAFAMGMGFFLEGGGDDTYEALWYVQGAGAHTSVVYFDEHAGNDEYDPTFPIVNTSIGVGHDFTVALHYDEAGDDAYHGPNLSLGSGYDNGFGILVNAGGTDTFASTSPLALGAAGIEPGFFGTSRQGMPTVGVFVRAGGATTYAESGGTGPAAGATWSFNPDDPPDAGVTTGETSVGVDRPRGAVNLP